MTYEKWFDKFKPIMAAPQKEMQTTVDVLYDPDYHWNVDDSFLKAQRVVYVWTLLDDDTIVPGYQSVNRVAYFICRVPWTKADKDLRIEMSIER